MILVIGLVMLAILGRVENTKFGLVGEQQQVEQLETRPPLSPPPPPPAFPTYQRYQQLPPREPEFAISSGQPVAIRPPQQPYFPPQTIAYVILRPVQHSVPYEPIRYDRQYLPPSQPSFEEQRPIYQNAPIKGAEPIVEHQVKGVPEETEIRPENEDLQSHQAMEPIMAKGHSKLMKLKSHFDKFAASAKSKFTLGSSYQVVNEEFVPPPPPPQPLAPQPVPAPVAPVAVAAPAPPVQHPTQFEQQQREEAPPIQQERLVPQQLEQQREEKSRAEKGSPKQQFEETAVDSNDFRRHSTRHIGQKQVA